MEEIKLFKCNICDKEFSSLKSLKSHIGHHVRRNEVDSTRGLSSIKYHYPNINISTITSLHKVDNKYICECGREFINKQSFVSHCGHCEIHLGYKPKWRGSNIQEWWSKLKEEDPNKFHELHSKAGSCSVKASIDKYGVNTLSLFNSTPSAKRDEAHRKQSETRKRKYLSGELTPAEWIGISHGSYFNSMYIRSSYELIYVAYLYINSFDFTYESVRVRYGNKSYISDFKIGDELVEVKGRIKDIPKVREAFEYNGYKIRFITPSDINKIKLYLRNLIKIDDLLEILKKSRKDKKFLQWKIDRNSMIIYYRILNSKSDPNNNNDIKFNLL